MLLLEAMADIVLKNRWLFGRNEDTKRTFRNKLTFNINTWVGRFNTGFIYLILSIVYIIICRQLQIHSHSLKLKNIITVTICRKRHDIKIHHSHIKMGKSKIVLYFSNWLFGWEIIKKIGGGTEILMSTFLF